MVVQDCRERAISFRFEQFATKCEFVTLKINDIGCILRVCLINTQQSANDDRNESPCQD